MTILKTAAYVRAFEVIFHVYSALYVEKASISVWAAMLIFGWPKKLI